MMHQAAYFEDALRHISTDELIHFDPWGRVKLLLLRLDLIDPEVSGNKWFKLKYNLADALQTGASTIVTYGGAYSNHIAATASAAQIMGLSAIGLIRGEERVSNETLRFAEHKGMQLLFLPRNKYRNEPYVFDLIGSLANLQECYFIPEGGNNALGIKGCGEILNHTAHQYDIVALASGTFATCNGIFNTLPANKQLLVFPAVKNVLNTEIPPSNHINYCCDYLFGGFAKYNQQLIDFIQEFYDTYQIELDFVYTAKMMYGLRQLLYNQYFEPGTTVLAIHTGGLQGNQSIKHLLHS